MTRLSPLVSVIIPLYNGARFIRKAIESVLHQTYPRIEVLIIDDGSTDGGIAKLSKYQDLKIVHQEHAGPALARNCGCSIANGDFFAFLDQDDVWMPRKLELQIERMCRNASIGAVVCHQKMIFTHDALATSVSTNGRGESLQSSFSPSALLMRRKTWEALGGLNPSFPLYSEADLFIRLRDEKIPIEILPEVLLLKRFHGSNLSYNVSETSSELLRTARLSVARKRRLLYQESAHDGLCHSGGLRDVLGP